VGSEERVEATEEAGVAGGEVEGAGVPATAGLGGARGGGGGGATPDMNMSTV
jgi:hypothetical protein